MKQAEKIMIFFLSYIISNNNYAQQIPPGDSIITKKIKLIELNINDTSFLNALDTFIFHKSCESIRNSPEGFFSVTINENHCNKSLYEFILEFHKSPIINDSAMGYFVYNDFTFIIYGNRPKQIFEKTSNINKFTIKTHILPKIQDFPFWKIKYEMGKYDLIFVDCW